MIIVASYPGSSQLFNIAQEKNTMLKSWEEPAMMIIEHNIIYLYDISIETTIKMMSIKTSLFLSYKPCHD